MSIAEHTKLTIAYGLKELLNLTPFEDISIGDIAKYCHMSRNTFYYHFKDKYDIITWIFYTEIKPIIEAIGGKADWSNSFLSLCFYMQENKQFYINALQIRGTNSFAECLMDYYEDISEGLLLNTKYTQFFSIKEVQSCARFCAHAMAGAVLDWAKEGMREDPTDRVILLEKMFWGQVSHPPVSQK